MRGLPYEVKRQIQKARESALLAVETYNRPTANFRSGAFVVLMVIAWTALFHAIFVKRRVKPYYRKLGSRRFQKVDGDYRCWELAECTKQFFKDQNPAVRKNLEFFVALRNKIEHRSLPRLDAEIFGECQALLMNFEDLICGQFSDRYSVGSGLNFALQFSRSPRSARPQPADERGFKPIKEFVDRFRSSLTADVLGDTAFSYKVFLIPKIGSHAAGDTIAVEFVKYDPSKATEMSQFERVAALIKTKQVPVANLGLKRPSDVVIEVARRLGRPFNMHHHVLCYRHFNARPAKGAADPTACDSRYCVYDNVHRDYVYTPEWVDLLVEKLSDEALYNALLVPRITLSAPVKST